MVAVRFVMANVPLSPGKSAFRHRCTGPESRRSAAVRPTDPERSTQKSEFLPYRRGARSAGAITNLFDRDSIGGPLQTYVHSNLRAENTYIPYAEWRAVSLHEQVRLSPRVIGPLSPLFAIPCQSPIRTFCNQLKSGARVNAARASRCRHS